MRSTWGGWDEDGDGDGDGHADEDEDELKVGEENGPEIRAVLLVEEGVMERSSVGDGRCGEGGEGRGE